MVAVVFKEEAPKVPYVWLSFADPDRPKGEQFLGVCIVQAPDPGLALMVAHSFGCNPGGEVMFAGFNAESCPVDVTPYLNRLLSRDDLKSAGLA